MSIMKPVIHQRRVELEREVGGPVCPLNVEDQAIIEMGIFVGFEMPLQTYQCAFDGGTARGGKQSESVVGRAITPCSREYAEQCPNYQLARLYAREKREDYKVVMLSIEDLPDSFLI